MNTPAPLSYERDVLRRILDRLMAEEVSLDNLCKHVPRVVSVAANVARIQSVLESANQTDDIDALLKALAELSADDEHQEEDAW